MCVIYIRVVVVLYCWRGERRAYVCSIRKKEKKRKPYNVIRRAEAAVGDTLPTDDPVSIVGPGHGHIFSRTSRRGRVLNKEKERDGKRTRARGRKNNIVSGLVRRQSLTHTQKPPDPVGWPPPPPPNKWLHFGAPSLGGGGGGVVVGFGRGRPADRPTRAPAAETRSPSTRHGHRTDAVDGRDSFSPATVPIGHLVHVRFGPIVCVCVCVFARIRRLCF